MTKRTRKQNRPAAPPPSARRHRRRAKAERAARKKLRPTLGPLVIRWMERNLVHGPGDVFGQPYRPHAYFKRFVYEAYELLPDGSRAYDRGLLGVPKGQAKTENAAALALAELCGPVVFDGWNKDGTPRGRRRLSPEIPCAAASFDQADKVFGCAVAMVENGPLLEFLEPYGTEILIKGEPGKIFRVAAAAGTNDGGMPTFFVADEVHEWTGNKKRVHVVLSNGRAKRKDSWELNISTAADNIDSLLGQMVKLGKAIQEGKAKDDKFLFHWYEYVEPIDPETGEKIELDFTDEKALAEAIRQANPASDSYVSIESRLLRATQIPEYEFRRYYLNQFVDAPERWLPAGAWERATDPERKPPAERADVVLFLEGTYNGKSVGIVGATVEDRPHLFLVKSWEKGLDPKWKVSLGDIGNEIAKACEKWTVHHIGINPDRWPQTAEEFEESGKPVVKWQSHLASRMVPACAQFFDAVNAADGPFLTHDGNDRIASHISSALLKIDGRGPRIVKEHDENQERYIDLAVAAVGAYDLAVRAQAGAGNTWSPV